MNNILLLILLFVVTPLSLMSSETLKVGSQAPAFLTVDQEGKPVALKDFLGKTVVLYFYPRDDTPGCTIEAKGFRDKIAEFKEKGAVILGVSFDNQSSHQKFQKKYDLPFQLLVDADKKIAKAYGAGGFLFASRHTIIIDEKGKIKKIYRKVSPAQHIQELLEGL